MIVKERMAASTKFDKNTNMTVLRLISLCFNNFKNSKIGFIGEKYSAKKISTNVFREAIPIPL
jgi:hypothetical protein